MKKTKTIYKILTITSLIVFVAFFSCATDEIDLTKPIKAIENDPDPDPDPDPDSGLLVAEDEDIGAYTTCNSDGEGGQFADIPNAVNVGTIDDRSCYADYKESIVGGVTWGVYNITDGSNNVGTTLQPRIERALPIANSNVGSFTKFTGDFRILEVGDAGSDVENGTYIAQAKGKHTGGGGSPDPAICLYLAKPKYGTGVNANIQVAFDIYAERIKERGGSGSNGREVVYLTTVDKNAITSFVLEVGFKEDPSDSTKKIHYCNAIIGGEAHPWNIPDPERGTQSKIRYGAYRVKGGRAQIRWANTTHERVQN
ncbi:hypothetical protein H7U19_06800 [Hyunsoonleella sp. SJ7]|uniref:PL28 ulvan lyase domain-containing protein n=1 Tax=Hyunsoonleella aquatilis TaxID=2762758 RepID=A0A923KLN3_9FLAO|nr:hypothetical protein [Hyunsoonleella aquatilis]MBC3758105.1 hypothetical protein [Hyunsoonleella aquatilis]